MLRFYFVIIPAIVFNLYYIPLMWYCARHPEKYSEEDCYIVARGLVNLIIRRGRISTVTMGKEHLPEVGGYIMYANHQGKYDVLGIVASHDKPSAIVIDKTTTKKIMPRLYTNLVKGKQLDKNDPRQQVNIIHEVSEEILQGRRYLIFPEGGYADNKNNLQEFHNGSFKIPLKTKCPIVPVVLYDSYKPFGENSLKKVSTQVHYLEPIYYEQFAGMSTKELCTMVYSKINEKLIDIEHDMIHNTSRKAV